MHDRPDQASSFHKKEGSIIDTGSTGKIESQTFDQPVVAFVFGASGLMAGVSLEGSKISRLEE